MANLRFLGSEEVRQALPMVEAIAGMKEAYAQLSAGKVTVPLRSRIDIPDYNGIALFMPAYLSQSNDLAVKTVTIYPDNATRGEPVIHATVLVLDTSSGRPLALLEGGSLTAIRTGAGSGAATDLLARSDAHTVAIFGSGVQARTQLEAVCTVREISEVRVFSLNTEQAKEFVSSLAGKGPIPAEIRVVGTPAEAILNADIVCTATTSRKPVFAGRDLSPGTHVNAIGAFTPEMQEVDADTIRRSLVVVDSRAAVMEEAGDLLIPLATGIIDIEHIQTEVGEIILGLKPGRTGRDQITYFKSVGVAVQDAVAARIALSNAIAGNLGMVESF